MRDLVPEQHTTTNLRRGVRQLGPAVTVDSIMPLLEQARVRGLESGGSGGCGGGGGNGSCCYDDNPPAPADPARTTTPSPW